MKKYEVTIQETLVRKVTVEADDMENAEDIVRRRYDRADLVLDADDFSDVQFSTKQVPARNREKGR